MKHRPAVEPEDLRAWGQAIGVPLSEEQVARLVALETALREQAVPLGLMAEGDRLRIRTRHTLDCLRAARTVSQGDREAFDLGSGAGLPGLVVAIACPDLSIVMVESRRRGAAFLEFAVELLDVPNVSVAATKVEALRSQVDLCFARALASLDRCWELSRNLLRPGGRLVYFAGNSAEAPRLLAGASSVAAVREPMLASAGPLVIMARQ